MSRIPPDPNDPMEPRIWTEWTDKFGNVIRPGDYVAYRRNKNLLLGHVIRINKLRSDGKTAIFTQASGRYDSQTRQWVVTKPGRPSCTLYVQVMKDLGNGKYEPFMHKRQRLWDKVAKKYYDNPDTSEIPEFFTVKEETDFAKVEYRP